MNKFFINKQLGIKQSVIDSVLVIMSLLVMLAVTTLPASAKQYVQSFQNNTTTLSGQAVQANMYFVKMGYWQVDQATLNLNFQVSQLTNRQTSDITVAVNGITFDSFRPKKTTGMQTRQIII
ncbi:cellulose biosynthesis cyclic di-GMP-binding regulatory protein BcsB [Secundilactobacillus odoratitofui]|nr:cellulose biosynthesis cyclic di-GMP-binding regulatory protein BcsB [Secundilactobacillus odoratitofui]